MVDVSNYTFDTPILINIMRPGGVYIPELKTYTPLETYSSIEDVICILNRGIIVTFPKESSEKEISKKIEEMILLYKEKESLAREKAGYVGTDINQALDTIQNINDTAITLEEAEKELENNLFEYSDITNRIVRNLSNNMFSQIFDSDDFKSATDRMDEIERERKSRDRLEKQKSIVRKNLTEDADLYLKLVEDKEYIYGILKWYDNIVFTDFGEKEPEAKKKR